MAIQELQLRRPETVIKTRLLLLVSDIPQITVLPDSDHREGWKFIAPSITASLQQVDISRKLSNDLFIPHRLFTHSCKHHGDWGRTGGSVAGGSHTGGSGTGSSGDYFNVVDVSKESGESRIVARSRRHLRPQNPP